MALKAKAILRKLKNKKIRSKKKSNYDKFKEKREYEKIKKYTKDYGPLPGEQGEKRIAVETRRAPPEKSQPSEIAEKKKKSSSKISTDEATFNIEGPVTIEGGVIPSMEEERKILRKDEDILIMPDQWKAESYSGHDERYPLQGKESFAHIYWNKGEGMLQYDVIEPKLSRQEEISLRRVEDVLGQELEVDFQKLGESDELVGYIGDKVSEVCSELGIKLTKDSFKKLMYYITRNYIGLGGIEPLLHDIHIEDISCDGTGVPVYVVHNKYGSVPTNIVFNSDEDSNSLVIKMAQRANRHISVSDPLLDGRLPDGSRVQATFSREVTQHGPTFTIRKFQTEPMTPTLLINYKSCPPRVFAYLWVAIEHAYTASTLISGGTATGKTSMLNALSMFLPATAKIVTIEDTQELNLPHEHWIPSVTRAGFGNVDVAGKRQGEVTMFDLLRAALRQRPDYLVVGEIRGEEANVMFTGMATGHPGMGTIHADSMDALVNRLTTRPISLSPALLQSLSVVVQLTHAKVGGKALRRAKEIIEITGIDMDKGQPISQKVFQWNPSDDTFKFVAEESNVVKRIALSRGMEQEEVWEEINRRAKVLTWMASNNIVHYKDVGRIIKSYSQDPERILNKIK
ncbi:MAG: type II/IV secretion system ATPase subunit [Euryarchaeota archaeon]|nr:type II/IV secretion system ATPase subunit [Euryarchaeota archaeon]